MAFPSTYDGSMFEKPDHKKPFERAAQQRKQREEKLAAQQQEHQEVRQAGQVGGQGGQGFSKRVEELQKHGRKITVVGVAPNPHHPDTYIIAGTYRAKNDAQIEPAAVRIDEHTLVLNAQGEQVIPLMVEKLHEGEKITVEGKKSKRGVINADCVMLS